MAKKIDYDLYRKIKRAIRENNEVGANKEISKEFGISLSTFHRIKASKTLKEYREKLSEVNAIARNKKYTKELELDAKANSFELFAGDVEEETKTNLWTKIWQKFRRNNG